MGTRGQGIKGQRVEKGSGAGSGGTKWPWGRSLPKAGAPGAREVIASDGAQGGLGGGLHAALAPAPSPTPKSQPGLQAPRGL